MRVIKFIILNDVSFLHQYLLFNRQIIVYQSKQAKNSKNYRAIDPVRLCRLWPIILFYAFWANFFSSLRGDYPNTVPQKLMQQPLPLSSHLIFISLSLSHTRTLSISFSFSLFFTYKLYISLSHLCAPILLLFSLSLWFIQFYKILFRSETHFIIFLFLYHDQHH